MYEGRNKEDRGHDNDRAQTAGARADRGRPLIAYALTEKGDKTYFTRVGVAFTNRDQSITIQLDAVPVSGTLQLRAEESRQRSET